MKPNQIRVVFDSAAELNGMSLNPALIFGPDHMNSLPGGVIRFRQESVAISCDVEQMFYCIHVNETDQAGLSGGILEEWLRPSPTDWSL